MKAELTPEQEKGVAAVIYLQKIGGVTEPPERALREWNKMGAGDKEYTLRLHKLFVEVDEERKAKKNAKPTRHHQS